MAKPATTLTALADHAEQTMRQQRPATQTGLLRLPTLVQGRVFRRLHLFAQLPHELKAQADAVAVYLGERCRTGTLFSHRHWSRGGRAVGPIVRGLELVGEIVEFLRCSQATEVSERVAQQLADTLVLSGLLSPVHEPDDEPLDLDSPARHTYVTPRGYYELVSSAVLRAIQTQRATHANDDPRDARTALPRDATVSVWDVVDGATRAGTVFRKRPPSLLHRCVASISLCHVPQGHETQCYVVVNRMHRALFVFCDDVARRAIACVPLRDAVVQFERGWAMYHGLTVASDDHTERLDFVARREQLAWMLALLDGGARYKESDPEIMRIVATPFYAQRDALAAAPDETVAMGDLVRGRVVVLVNVAMQDPDAALQWPELLALAEAYASHGLVVVACPSDQFLGPLERTRDREIEHEFVSTTLASHANVCVMATRDVNGPGAREPFLYCNAHLPGAMGPFTEWNFTKFVLDRTGKPVRRYETHVLPREMESDLVRLLGIHRHGRPREVPPPEGMAETEASLAPARVAHEMEQSARCDRST